MSDPINLTFGFDRRLFRRALMAFWFSAVPRPSTSYRLIFWIIVWLAILAGVIVVGAMRIPPAIAWGAAVVILGLFVLGLQRVRMARFYRALAEHWDRTGDMVARFDQTGMTLTQAGTRMEFAWTAVDAVVRARGGTVFRIGMTMIAIPDRTLPEGMSARDFRSRIAAWRTP